VKAPHAAITVRRRVEWAETDASGHYHFSSVFRWFEEAEHALWNSLNINKLMFGRVPRVHVDVDYKERLWFDQEVDVQLLVERVGRTSCGFRFEVLTLAGEVAATGGYTIVHAPDPTGPSRPWPTEILEALSTGLALANHANQA
jgi:YbgC/YbaW family acyl-CoA thioester hydrolase